jgi:hypothetical protein
MLRKVYPDADGSTAGQVSARGVLVLSVVCYLLSIIVATSVAPTSRGALLMVRPLEIPPRRHSDGRERG